MICNNIIICSDSSQLSCPIKADCKQMSGTRSRFVCKDTGSKRDYRLVNDTNANIAQYLVDGGIYYNEQNISKCDFLLVVHGAKKKFVFVELKGKDVDHGLDQLRITITQLKSQLRGGVIYARLVYKGGASGRAAENTSAIIDAWKKLRKVLGITKDNDKRLKKQSISMEEKVSKL